MTYNARLKYSQTTERPKAKRIVDSLDLLNGLKERRTYETVEASATLYVFYTLQSSRAGTLMSRNSCHHSIVFLLEQMAEAPSDRFCHVHFTLFSLSVHYFTELFSLLTVSTFILYFYSTSSHTKVCNNFVTFAVQSRCEEIHSTIRITI